MTFNDIIVMVKNNLPEASIMQIRDEARTFVLEHSLNSHWKYQYDIDLYYSGTATSTAATLSDSSASFATDGSLIGQTINNTTDGSSGTITATTANTITATLSGGTNNTWTSGDAYTIQLTNDIRLPKTINNVCSMYVDNTFIPMTIGWEGFRNGNEDAIDPYSGNVNIVAPTDQACILLEDYIMHFVDNLSSTGTMYLWVEKMLTDDISESTLTTNLALPDKMKLPMAYFVLHRLFLYAGYFNSDLSMFWKQQYERIYRGAKTPVNKQHISRRSNGKSGGKYSYQNTKGLR